MTRKSIARQHTDDRVRQSYGTSLGVEVRNSWSGNSTNDNGALVASNLQKLPTWIPISDYLLRSDDTFPYGKMSHRFANMGVGVGAKPDMISQDSACHFSTYILTLREPRWSYTQSGWLMIPKVSEFKWPPARRSAERSELTFDSENGAGQGWEKTHFG
ncbi:hypothetical protein F5Y12DRAFT_779142 [Xylaria sp. FL1777]|nr:hypothetical protein F5Y12DRAFT_779142 [Xylaria sp. FL1777]